MPHANIFGWRDGAGWIVLSGGGAPGNEIEALALTRLPPGDPVAYIWAADSAESADLHLAALDEAGAPTGYLVDVQAEDDDTIGEQLAQAGMIILGDGPDIGALRGGIAGAALDGMAQAHARRLDPGDRRGRSGTRSKVSGGESPRAGFSWLEKAILVPGYSAERDAEAALRIDPASGLVRVGDQPRFGAGVGFRWAGRNMGCPYLERDIGRAVYQI